MDQTTLKKQVFAANLPADVTEDDLRNVFSKFGDIEGFAWTRHENRGFQYALIEMNSEKSATKARNSLNGYKLKDHYLAVTPPDLGDRDKLSSKQRKSFEKIAQELEETEEVPLRQLEAIIMLCGTNFAEAILRETEEVEANGGIMTTDGSRRRTKGGVFFYLARFRMPHELRRIVYNRKGRMPADDLDEGNPDDADTATQSGLVKTEDTSAMPEANATEDQHEGVTQAASAHDAQEQANVQQAAADASATVESTQTQAASAQVAADAQAETADTQAQADASATAESIQTQASAAQADADAQTAHADATASQSAAGKRRSAKSRLQRRRQRTSSDTDDENQD